ncbi:MAG: hypothetical protein ACYTEK_24180, partial [Planctomycetota bacterium]
APTENASKTLPRQLSQVPRSVQSGFSHRLRDGKNHIYLEPPENPLFQHKNAENSKKIKKAKFFPFFY